MFFREKYYLSPRSFLTKVKAVSLVILLSLPVGQLAKSPCCKEFTISRIGKNGLRITESGLYTVTNRLVYRGSGYAITIAANDVYLDFQGQSLDLENTGNNAILVEPGVSSVTIANGSILNTGPTPTPVLDWNNGLVLNPAPLTGWTFQQAMLALLQSFRYGDPYGGAVVLDSTNATFPSVEFTGAVASTGIEISNTSGINIQDMYFENNYVCIDAVNGPVNNLLVENCHAWNFGRIVNNPELYPNATTNVLTGSPTLVPFIPGDIVYFGYFINLGTRQARYDINAPPNTNITIVNNIAESVYALHGVFILPGEDVVVDSNKINLPGNHDGYERNENWGVTLSNVTSGIIGNNEFFNAIHAITPWGVQDCTVENNKVVDTHEQGIFFRVAIDFTMRNNVVEGHGDQMKVPAGASVTVPWNDSITNMNRIGTDSVGSGNIYYGYSASPFLNGSVFWYYYTPPSDIPNGPWFSYTGSQEAVTTVDGFIDHTVLLINSTRNGLIEGNIVSSFRDTEGASTGLSITDMPAAINTTGQSSNLVVRNNTMINCKNGFRYQQSMLGGLQNPINPGGVVPPNASLAPIIPGFVFYGNTAFNNGWIINGTFIPADFVGFDSYNIDSITTTSPIPLNFNISS